MEHDYIKYLDLFKKCANRDDYHHTFEGGSYCMEYVDGGRQLNIWLQQSWGFSDWSNNLDFAVQAYNDSKLPWKVHRGFHRVWKSMDYIVKSYIEPKYIERIQIVGYSHGAALAMLCHEYCIYNRPDCMVVGYGFGCPRVLNGKYPDELLKRWENFTVIRNADDIVTRVPPELFSFHHVGQVVDLTPSGFYIKQKYEGKFPKRFFEKFIAGHRPENIISQLEEKINENDNA